MEIKEKMFGGEKSEQYNSLMQALKDCAKDENAELYDWIEGTAKTTMVVFLVDKLNELGFEIKALAEKGEDK